MSELKRLYNLKTLFILLALVIINTGLFMMSCDTDKQITLTGNDLQTYIDEYPDFLKQTKNNSILMSSMNMYKSGYASDNIRKTAESYEKLENITLKADDNRGIVVFSDYELTDIFLLAFLMIMAARLLSERRKGLVNMIRSTKDGRAKLYSYRIIILFISAVIGGILLYGGNLLGSSIIYGTSDLSRGIQSIPEFMLCPFKISISEYILLSCFLKVAACFAAALVFYLVISIFGTAAAYVITGLAAVAEFLLYTLIIPVSSMNGLKFINIIAVLRCSEIFKVCQNINIFGNAVSAINCDAVFLAILLLINISVGFYIHGKMYVQSRNLFSGIEEKIKKILEKFAIQRSLLGWELYKTLIKQGGVIFIIAAFALTYSASIKYRYIYIVNEYEEYFYNVYEGELNDEKFDDMTKEKDNLERTIERCNRRIEQLMQSEYDNRDIIARLDSELQRAIRKLNGLMPVYENAKDGMEYIQRTGRQIDLIKPYSYDLLLQRDRTTRNRASLYILMGIIGAVSGIFAFDKQNNMTFTLRSSYRGRCFLNISKIITVFGISVILCTALHMIQLVQIGNLLGFNNLSSPLQSLMFMRDRELHVSIREYLFLLFAVRSISAFGVGVICMIISRVCPDTVSAMGVSVFILAVPAVFSELVNGAGFINAVYLISGEMMM